MSQNTTIGEPLTLAEYKKVLLKILNEIDLICAENHLHYQLAYGTLLGAIRHGGFIPWDDDVDIIMPRKDYIALQEVISSGNHSINFITIDTEPKTIYPYGKICALNTIAYESNFKKVPGYGAFVDVFPVDFVPASEKKRKRIFRKYSTFVKLIQHSSRTGYSKNGSGVRIALRAVAFKVGRFIDTEKAIKKLDYKLQHLCPDGQTKWVGVPWDNGGKAFLTKDVLNSKKVKFENLMLNAPVNYNDMLTKMYGDYMTLPPEEQRVNPHNIKCYYKK